MTADAEEPKTEGTPAEVEKTLVLPRLYTGETMLLPVARHLLRLRVTEGPDAGRSCTVEAAGGTVGRRQDALVVLTDPAVSRHHARIELRDDVFYIVDTGSSNGVVVNGFKVSESALHDGDVISLGHDRLSVEVPETD